MTSCCATVAILVLQFSLGAFGAGPAVAGESTTITLEDDLVIGLEESAVPLGRIVDVAVDSRENIYVLDASAQTIHKFTRDGRHLASIGRPGEGPGEFNAPECLAIGSDDRLYVSGRDLYVEVFAADATPLDRVKRINTRGAQSLAVDDQGDIYVVAIDLIDQFMIHKYSGESGRLVRSFCNSYAVGDDVDTREESIYAMGAVAVRGDRIFYVQSYPHIIRTFDLSGNLLMEFDARTAESREPEVQFLGNRARYSLPASFSRTIVPLEDGVLLTILGLPFEGSDGSGYLDLYRQADGARIASIESPPTFDICCRDSRNRLYSVEARDDVPVVVRYRLEQASAVGN